MQTLQLGAGDNGYQDGDSTGDKAFQYQVFALLQLRFCSTYGGCRWTNTAVSGATLAQIATRMATNVPIFKPTFFVGHMGINDVRTGADLNAVSIPAFTTILNLTAGAGIKTYILGPGLNGEKSDGSNTGDAAIVALDNAMAALAAAYPLCKYRSVRQYIYPLELTQNTPAPGTAIGPFTRPDTTPGVHWNPYARSLIDTNLIQADVTLN